MQIFGEPMTDKTPLGVTFGSLAVLGPRAIIDVANKARDLGYRSIWTVEANGTDAFSLLAAVSAVAPELSLGTGIVPVQLRTPTLTAMSAATLQGARSPQSDDARIRGPAARMSVRRVCDL
jgi:alkanesulfonate monooxygenase SsuD/methylene tetrahydromethanopterin reductase-like flavin-dependent oxidoreductase (luciferase family)